MAAELRTPNNFRSICIFTINEGLLLSKTALFRAAGFCEKLGVCTSNENIAILSHIGMLAQQL